MSKSLDPTRQQYERGYGHQMNRYEDRYGQGGFGSNNSYAGGVRRRLDRSDTAVAGAPGTAGSTRGSDTGSEASKLS
jgi:hypothetical protein